jgi:predicted nucleic acid-binding protein
MTFLENEAGADRVADLFEQAETGVINLFLSFVTFTEIYYITIQKRGNDFARKRMEALEALPVKRIESNAKIGKIAGDFKAAHRVSFADAWIAALAKNKNATLVHKDPEFECLESQLDIIKLPYKSASEK